MSTLNLFSSSHPRPHLDSHRLAIAVASTVFCVVSMGANVQYGMTLGTSSAEKVLYVAASVAADLVKIAAPALALTHWYERKGGLATIAFGLWLAAMTWSTSSAMGFALSTRDTAAALREAHTGIRSGWITTIERAESNLAALGRVRPSTVIKAELAALSIDPLILRRTRHCSELTSEAVRRVCAPMLKLKTELATAEAAEKLQEEATTSRAQLATIPVVGSQPDPPARALARLVGTDEAAVRVGFALLLAGLVEAGSTLGLTLISVTGRVSPTQPHLTGSKSGKQVRPPSINNGERSAATELVERWVDGHTKRDPAAEIRARDAYLAFSCWASRHGLAPITETAFGREFKKRVLAKGGQKLKRRDRTYYVGISVN